MNRAAARPGKPYPGSDSSGRPFASVIVGAVICEHALKLFELHEEKCKSGEKRRMDAI
jgi:hypothetical protein